MKVRWAWVLALALQSCVPLPHMKNLTPLAEGVVTRGGQPVPDLRVRAVAGGSEANACSGEYSETLTGPSGEFALLPVRHHALFVSIFMPHQVFRWQLCTWDGGAWRRIDQSERFTISDAGPWWISRFRCDLSAESPCVEKQDVHYTEDEARALMQKASARSTRK